MVRSPANGVAVGGRGIGVWGCWGGGPDWEVGEGEEGEGEKGEGGGGGEGEGEGELRGRFRWVRGGEGWDVGGRDVGRVREVDRRDGG